MKSISQKLTLDFDDNNDDTPYPIIIMMTVTAEDC